VKFESTLISNVWIVTHKIYKDSRGSFQEWFKQSDIFKEAGISFVPKQANISISSKGTIRGIHYSVADGGQSKWVSCLSGAVRDFFVDLRIDSPTFLEWGFTDLDPTLGRTVFMGKGIGHAFQALENNSTLVYLLDGEYLPEKEFSINPFSDRIKIDWPITIHNLSDKDLNAPSIDDVINRGDLPRC
jgi:dTDP-4-dehydrorhamnose 3,5-epimerase